MDVDKMKAENEKNDGLGEKVAVWYGEGTYTLAFDIEEYRLIYQKVALLSLSDSKKGELVEKLFSLSKKERIDPLNRISSSLFFI
jgi:hypothetical protein